MCIPSLYPAENFMNFVKRRRSNDLSAADICGGDLQMRLHQQGRPQAVLVPIRHFHRRAGTGGGIGYQILRPQQPGRGVYAGGQGVSGLCSLAAGTEAADREPIRRIPQHHRAGAFQRFHPAVSLYRGRFPGNAPAKPGKPLSIYIERDQHGRRDRRCV